MITEYIKESPGLAPGMVRFLRYYHRVKHILLSMSCLGTSTDGKAYGKQEANERET